MTELEKAEIICELDQINFDIMPENTHDRMLVKIMKYHLSGFRHQAGQEMKDMFERINKLKCEHAVYVYGMAAQDPEILAMVFMFSLP